MYCRNCGKELPDQARFCTYCGADQTGQSTQMKPGNSKGLIVGIGVLAVGVVALLILCLTLLAGKAGNVKPGNRSTLLTEATAPAPEPTSAATLSRQGWYQEGGHTYYIKNGSALTGLQEIDHAYYYFYEDGAMAVNTRVDYGDDVLEFDRNGHLAGIVFATVANDWSDESYHFGNGGSAAIIEFSSGVEDCRSLTFYLRAGGEHGTHFNGKWKLFIKSHGTWEHVKDLDFQEPEGYFTITFDTPKDFDAMTVYPTIQGNATYNVYFDVYDVYCRP